MVIECVLVLQSPAMFQISPQAPTTADPVTRAAVMDPLLYVAAGVMKLDAMVMDWKLVQPGVDCMALLVYGLIDIPMKVSCYIALGLLGSA